MSDFTYYKSKEIYREKYYQMPKVFFTNGNYKSLSNDAKIAYMLLKDRFDNSVRNNWVDADDNIYFVYTVLELMQLLNCREGKVSKIKKELENVNLLRQKKGRIKKTNGKLETTPNFLYLGKPIVTSEDVFKINKDNNSNENPVIAKIAITEKVNNSNENPVIAKIAITEKVNNSNKNPVIAKIADNLLYSSSSDTYKDTVKDTEKENVQNRELLQSFSETQDQSFLDKRCLDLIALFSQTIQEATETIGIINRAKNKQQKKYDRILVAEDWSYEIENTLRKVYIKIKTDHKIKNQKNYMFGAFCTTFENCLLQTISADERAQQDLPIVKLINYLDDKG